MLNLSIALFVATAQLPTVRHAAVEDRGKLGTWYWRMPKGQVPIDEEEAENDVPVLETVGDPYRARTRSMLSRSPLVFFSPYTSLQVNVNAQGQNILGDAANEPSLAVDPNNRNRIVVGWRQFDSVASNFRQAGNGYSLNGGLTWNQHTVLTPGTFRSDPVLAPDALGNFHYNSLQQTFFDDVFTSTNSGIEWVLKGPATGGDKQWMTCDRTTGPGRGFLYQCWSTAGNNYNGRQFSRSVNGGTSWMNPINIPGQPVWGTLDVAANGNLYLCGMTNTAFQFSRSSNAQNSAVTPTFDRNVVVNMGGAIVFGAAMNPAGLLGQAWLVTDRSTGPHSGNIYMLCSVGVDTANPCQVNFVRSTDGGLTWSAPIALNDDPLNQGATHWLGALSVAPSGRLDACWFDNRANPTSNNSALFVTSSYDGGVTWRPNVQVTPYFNPNIGYPNQNKMGDYIGIVADTQGAHAVYAATFNGEEDIWHVRLPDEILMPSRATAIAPVQAKTTGGALSDVWNADGSLYSVVSSFTPKLGSTAAVETYYSLPVNDMAAINLKVRAQTSVSTTATVFMWNWKTQNWEAKQSKPWSGGTMNEETFNLQPQGSLDNYIYPRGNTVRCMVRFLNPGFPQFSAQYDLVQLLFG